MLLSVEKENQNKDLGAKRKTKTKKNTIPSSDIEALVVSASQQLSMGREKNQRQDKNQRWAFNVVDTNLFPRGCTELFFPAFQETLALHHFPLRLTQALICATLIQEISRFCCTARDLLCYSFFLAFFPFQNFLTVFIPFGGVAEVEVIPFASI